MSFVAARSPNHGMGTLRPRPIVCDVSALAADVDAVDVLCRLHVATRRAGFELVREAQLRDAVACQTAVGLALTYIR